MAKNKSIEEQIAEHEAAIKKLRDDAAAASVKEAEDLKAALQQALADYNSAAKATGGRAAAMRLITDAERASGGGGKGSGKRTRLEPEKVTEISDKIVKAVKANGTKGASKADIIKYLGTSGYELGRNFSVGHYNKIVGNLVGGDAAELTKTGDKSSTRYHLAK